MRCLPPSSVCIFRGTVVLGPSPAALNAPITSEYSVYMVRLDNVDLVSEAAIVRTWMLERSPSRQ